MKQKHKAKRSQNRWFTKIRGSYLPCSWQGWALYAPYMLYLIFIPTYLWPHFSIANILFVIVPNYIAALAVMTWIAARTS